MPNADSISDFLSLDDLQREEYLCADAAPCEVLARLIESVEVIVLSDSARAVEQAQVLVEWADRFDCAAARVAARRMCAIGLAYLNRLDEVESVLNEALRLGEQTGERLEWARAKLATLQVLLRTGRFDEAVVAAEAARAVFREFGATALEARAEINLGVASRMTDMLEAALEHFVRAEGLIQDDPLLLAQMTSNRAEVLLELNRFEEARRAFEGALAQFEAVGAARGAAIVVGNFADLLARQGRYRESVECFERARRHIDESAAPGDAARLESERAEVLAIMGLPGDAVAAYEKAIPRLEAHNLAAEAARAHLGLAQSLLATGRMRAARRELNEAAARFDLLGHRTMLGLCRLTLAQLESRAGAALAYRDSCGPARDIA